MMKLPETVEVQGGVHLFKRFGFFGIGMYENPRTGEIVVIDLREEVGKAEA